MITYTVINLSSTPPDLLTNGDYKTTKLVLKHIRAGTFQMGDEVGAHDADELPVHTVNITEDFFMGVFEVTQRQWYEVQGNWPSYFTTLPDKRPVEQVSFDDIQSFLASLSSVTGELIDLPTEAQWEFACKAGTSMNYSYGNTTDSAYMWYSDNSDTGNGQETHEVGTKLPNPWGLYDMHGNVWEWCRDKYSSTILNPPSYYQTCYDIGTVANPEGPSTGTSRVPRGGSWSNTTVQCRSANRLSRSPDSKYDYLGFRVAVLSFP